MSHPIQTKMSVADARNALTMLCTKKGCNDINCPMAHSNEELQRKLTSIEKKRKAKGARRLNTQVQERQRLPTQVLSFVIKEDKRRRKKGRKGRKGPACIVSNKRGQADTRASLQRGRSVRKPRSPTVLDPCRGEHAEETPQCESRALDCCVSACHY